MLDQILNNPDLAKYIATFETGRTIFMERDESQDLYILISGKLDVLKGNQIISEITEKGALFGEMSSILNDSRTATVRASSDAKVIRIPPDEVITFLGEFPDVAHEITRYLAKRLDRASQILYGLNEFYDQLPDALILTDKDGKILSLNTAAEKLYGGNWHDMHNRSLEEIYEEPEIYRDFLDEVQGKFAVKERILKVRHPEKGILFVSTSMNVLYDAHHNFTGVLSLGRDVTAAQKLEEKYRRVRNWLIPFLIILSLLTGTAFLGYLHYLKNYKTIDIKKQGFRDQLATDYGWLESLLAEHFENNNKPKTTQLMKQFFKYAENREMPYTGLVLLDKNRKVFNAYSIKKGAEDTAILGSSYGGIAFRGRKKTLHKVLSLYRVNKDHPMGHKGIEIAFEINRDNCQVGWLVFQMDMVLLGEKYNLDEEGLKELQFEEKP
ncbi:MAG: cyclic nucleotide-binding domain-containing protein [Thermodesulfobacteriota bacterium]|nr:cyclic nucleotide-binding domain-containing protein [Thermodesulfobacteriota bacterium]